MKILIIRHAIAEDRADHMMKGRPDAERPLVKKGVRRFRKVGLKISEILEDSMGPIYTSELVRAVQTGEILKSFSPSSVLKQTALLNPGFNPKDLINFIQTINNHDHVPAFIGHEPDLSHFLGELVVQQSIPLVRFKKGAVSLVDFTPPRSQILWHLNYSVIDR